MQEMQANVSYEADDYGMHYTRIESEDVLKTVNKDDKMVLDKIGKKTHPD